MKAITLLLDNYPDFNHDFPVMNQAEELNDFCKSNEIEIISTFHMSNLSDLICYVIENEQNIDMIIYDHDTAWQYASFYYGIWLTDMLYFNLTRCNVAVFHNHDSIEDDSVELQLYHQQMYNSDNSEVTLDWSGQSENRLVTILYIRKYGEPEDFNRLRHAMYKYCFENNMYFPLQIEETADEIPIKTNGFTLMKNLIDSFHDKEEDVSFRFITNYRELIYREDVLNRFYQVGITEFIFFFPIPSDTSATGIKYILSGDGTSIFNYEYKTIYHKFKK